MPSATHSLAIVARADPRTPRATCRCEILATAKTFSQHIGRGKYRELDCTKQAAPSCAETRAAAPTAMEFATAVDAQLARQPHCDCAGENGRESPRDVEPAVVPASSERGLAVTAVTAVTAASSESF